jgi:homoserine kinase
VNQPVLGCVLSGGGPAMLVIVNEKNKDAMLKYLKTWAEAEEQSPLILDIPVSQHGIQEVVS